MAVIDILNQLSSIYGQPTPAALEANNNVFQSPTSAADAPKVLSPDAAGPTLFEPYETICKLECMLFLWQENLSPGSSA